MKNDFLYILRKVEEIANEEPCKKKIQKLVYLIENTKIKLGYDYCIHFYGPYSAQLNDEMYSLFYEDKIELSYKGMSHCLSVKEKNIELNNAVKNETIDNILIKYSKLTPNDLERITTTLYVMQNIDYNSDDDIIQKVIDIKHSKYDKEEIQLGIKKIKEEELFVLKNRN